MQKRSRQSSRKDMTKNNKANTGAPGAPDIKRGETNVKNNTVFMRYG